MQIIIESPKKYDVENSGKQFVLNAIICRYISLLLFALYKCLQPRSRQDVIDTSQSKHMVADHRLELNQVILISINY